VVAGDSFRGLDGVVVYVAHVPADLDVDQVVVVGSDALQVGRQWADGPAQFHHLTFEQIDGLDVGRCQGGEDLLLHGVDVGFDQIGDVEVGVHDMVGDRVHHRVGTQLQVRRRGLQPLAYTG